jgi:hypothetical protein
MNLFAQWGPAIFMVIAIWIGLICNNKRLDDFRDFFKDLLRSEISGSESRIKAEIAVLRSDIARLDARVERLEEHRLVRP